MKAAFLQYPERGAVARHNVSLYSVKPQFPESEVRHGLDRLGHISPAGKSAVQLVAQEAGLKAASDNAAQPNAADDLLRLLPPRQVEAKSCPRLRLTHLLLQLLILSRQGIEGFLAPGLPRRQKRPVALIVVQKRPGPDGMGSAQL